VNFIFRFHLSPMQVLNQCS